ncbi:hypothetical protein CJF31_00001608 [Rutstroemia sp. NJR-2017a BVV2]|nr:hypothetical protein CJF31_00001608 [Rutstroemia sp. NJR-2017a BVV2]
MAFVSLLLEVLQYIAVCIETAYRPSLYTFRLTSKACYKAAVFLVFRQIIITVHDREGLRRDIDRLIEALSRTDSSPHIQCINIKGDLRLNAKKTEGWGRQAPTDLNKVLGDEEPVFYHGPYAVYDKGIIEKFSEKDIAWAPVVNLLQAKIHLKDLLISAESSQGTLRAISLIYLIFRFRTLLWGIHYSYEIELATSPSLYRCARRDSNSDDDFNLETMIELTTGLAPNLKEVIILNLLLYSSFRSQGLPGFTGGKVGSLTSLSLKGVLRLQSPTVLQNWARHIDFACLQHLNLGSGLSVETMKWLSFPRVQTLSVCITPVDFCTKARTTVSTQSLFFRLSNLLKNYPSTGRLNQKSWILFCPIMLPFEFTKNRVLQIEAQCPVLEELTVLVKCNKSSTSEAEIYRCFGRMKSLRFLFLILDCSNWRVIRNSIYNPTFDEEDQKLLDKPLVDLRFLFLKRGELKETLINCAVEEALARSIWKTINQNKTGRRLERLKLWSTGGGVYGTETGLPVKRNTTAFSAIRQNLARSWIFERGPRDDEEEGFTVRELGQYKRMARDQHDVNYWALSENSDIWEVFHPIWPSKEGSKDWRDDWSSFSLQI